METVDSGDVREITSTSLALDSRDKVHLSYYSGVSNTLMYATNAEFTLTVAKSGFGTGTVISNPLGIDCGGDCSELYVAGTVVTLTATPDAGSFFAGWGGDSDCFDGQVAMNGRKICIATFNSLLSTLTVNKSGLGTGTVTSSPLGINCGADCSEVYDTGMVVALTATADPGYMFSGWTGDPDCADGQVTLNGDKTCTANFAFPGVPLFVDAPFDHWAYNMIMAIYDAGITGGCSTNPLRFCPDGTLTRGQMAVFIETALGHPANTCTGRFADVPIGNSFCGFVERMADDGITSGCGGVNFCPDDPVTRGQMAVFIEAALGHSSTTCTGQFADVTTVHPFCRFIEHLATDGITSGCGGLNFCPDNPVTRAQMAVFLVAAPDPLLP
jgi:hypothetical protein